MAALDSGAADVERLIRMKPGTQSVTVRGKVGPSDKVAKYRFYARAGQKCKVLIEPDGDLTTAGHLFVPGLQEGYGGPGGTIYDGVLPRTGNYRIWVERRAGKSDTFSLTLICKTPQRK
jgi:hypothetical protein